MQMCPLGYLPGSSSTSVCPVWAPRPPLGLRLGLGLLPQKHGGHLQLFPHPCPLPFSLPASETDLAVPASVTSLEFGVLSLSPGRLDSGHFADSLSLTAPRTPRVPTGDTRPPTPHRHSLTASPCFVFLHGTHDIPTRDPASVSLLFIYFVYVYNIDDVCSPSSLLSTSAPGGQEFLALFCARALSRCQKQEPAHSRSSGECLWTELPQIVHGRSRSLWPRGQRRCPRREEGRVTVPVCPPCRSPCCVEKEKAARFAGNKPFDRLRSIEQSAGARSRCFLSGWGPVEGGRFAHWNGKIPFLGCGMAGEWGRGAASWR